jgi:hypothetical protein
MYTQTDRQTDIEIYTCMYIYTSREQRSAVAAAGRPGGQILLRVKVTLHIYIYIYIYIYTIFEYRYIHTHTHIYVYIYLNILYKHIYG